jgi:hypothetical protein
LDRERAILRAARLREDLFQPALFDRRVERERMKDRAQHQELIAALQHRLAHCERQAMLGVATVRLLLALQP